MTFLLDLRVGERLGFGMALALVVVAQQIVTSELMPVSNQRLWLGSFVAWSFYWVLFGVIQSVVIGFLFYIREDRRGGDDEDRVGLGGSNHDPEEETGLVPPPTTADERKDSTAKSFAKLSSRTDSFVQTVSLRKLDLLSLLFAVVTYTTFIVVMYRTNRTGAWLKKEPKWFNEEDITYDTSFYDIHDPST